jgi:predicted nucleotide-binding protein (sugar kinase/HSP70/actin superfamily)
MSLKQSFANQVKAQSDVWQAQIKDFQEQLEQASAKGQAEYMKMVTQLQEKAAEAMKMFERVQAANETAWKDMQTANQKAFAELQKGWAEALSRFE